VKINADTKKYFSVASKPGAFGATIYNQLFRLLGINAIYLPLGIPPEVPFFDIFHALSLIGAQGINISMPFKEQARLFARNLPESPNINTLTRVSSSDWHGWNTDGWGFLTALNDQVPMEKIQTVFIFGTGAVAQTIDNVFRHNGVICEMRREVPDANYDLFVNATPIGMPGIDPVVPWDRFVWRSKYVFDVVVGHETQLVKAAREARKTVIPGYMMAMYQLVRQFRYHFPEQQDVTHLVREEMKVMGYDI
jgi:shikimate 5-dehydrogenase